MNEADLRERGYKVFTRHLRFYTPIDNRLRVRTANVPMQLVGKSRFRPYPRGGITIVRLYMTDADTAVAEGEAFCSPRDNYDRKLGKQIALERAVLNLAESISNRRSSHVAG